MISYIITFLVGTCLGVVFMCLFQINKQVVGSFSNMNRTLVKRVDELCREKNLTYEELSCKSEIPFDVLLRMADGSVRNPSVVAIAKICKGLDVSLRYFFDTEEFRKVIL